MQYQEFTLLWRNVMTKYHEFTLLRMLQGAKKQDSIMLNMVWGCKDVAFCNHTDCTMACVPILLFLTFFNSLAPGRFEWDFRWSIFQLTSMISGWRVSCEIALWWMHLIDDKSKLVQVMAWCRQATSHYQNQCWRRSMLSYGVIRP